eukprot:TRINITY_DN10841_c0_g1_i1.p1 TRINITY_DN10841_c0_g1~~TRINITY_DN10841_c0_g1_i1.p1  ORF type:complete len:101 (+),score=6.21 TRINITY_DN10841_c0_g1_i1:131-433(+)
MTKSNRFEADEVKLGYLKNSQSFTMSNPRMDQWVVEETHASFPFFLSLSLSLSGLSLSLSLSPASPSALKDGMFALQLVVLEFTKRVATPCTHCIMRVKR